MRAAFRDLHGASLHGFALLVALGDRRRAARAAGDALAEGASQADRLRHPERAGAWLRAAVLRRLGRAGPPRSAAEAAAARAALHRLGASDETIGALARLSTRERAAIVASGIERFEPLDLETILVTTRSGVRRVVTSARRRYLGAMLQADLPAPAPGDGPLARRIRAQASRTLGGVGGSR